MGVSDEMMDGFSATYMAYMQRCMEYPNSRSGDELRALARECYKSLREKEEK
jgi:hypothetical protein